MRGREKRETFTLKVNHKQVFGGRKTNILTFLHKRFHFVRIYRSFFFIIIIYLKLKYQLGSFAWPLIPPPKKIVKNWIYFVFKIFQLNWDFVEDSGFLEVYRNESFGMWCLKGNEHLAWRIKKVSAPFGTSQRTLSSCCVPCDGKRSSLNHWCLRLCQSVEIIACSFQKRPGRHSVSETR